MKELAKIMRFDFQTVGSSALIGLLSGFGALILFAGLFVIPVAFLYLALMVPLFLISPLTAVAEKSGFGKLYGILPVSRKNITRARFLYIFLLCTVSELVSYLLVLISSALKLYRVMPAGNPEFRTMFEESFSFEKGMPLIFRIMFAACMTLMLVTALFTMIKLIKGAASTGVIAGICASVLLLAALAFFVLNSLDLMPVIELKNITLLNTKPLTAFSVVKCVIWHAAAFGLCTLWGEYTANKLAEREL